MRQVRCDVKNLLQSRRDILSSPAFIGSAILPAVWGDVPMTAIYGVVPVSKFKVDVNAGNGQAKPEAASAPEESETEAPSSAAAEVDFLTTATTIGVVGVAAALIDVALIPGIIIGVAAAFAPKYVPKLGDRLQPLFNTTVRGAYKLTRKARVAVAEAQERFHDLAAEVDAEHVAEAKAAPAAGTAS